MQSKVHTAFDQRSLHALQEDKRTGTDLERFLNALSPVSAPSPAATPLRRSSGRASGKRRPAGACESVQPALVAPGTGSVGSAAAPHPTRGGAPHAHVPLPRPNAVGEQHVQGLGCFAAGSENATLSQTCGLFPRTMLLL